MNKILKCFIVFVISLFIVTPFSIPVFAEESDVSTFALDGSNYTLNGVQQAKFDELISSLPNYSNVAIWYNSTESSLAWTYSISYNSTTSTATFTTRYQMRLDGSIQTQTSSTTNNIYDNTIVHYYVFKYNGVYITGENYIPSSPPVYPNIACPVALNDVLSNDYITSLLMYLYRVGVDQFIIYRLQETFDTSTLMNSLEVSQVGEFKGYILTTPNNTVQTFVYEYNRPTIISPDGGDTWTYQYLNILDPGYASDWEMVLHYTCLDSRYGSEFEAIENLNNSIQSVISQNATIIQQQSTTNSTLNTLNTNVSTFQRTVSNLINGSPPDLNAVNPLINSSSQLDDLSDSLHDLESSFNSNLTSSLSDINISSGNLSYVSDFTVTANWVKVQFDSVLDNSGIYKNAINFSLILGLALLLIGRRS